jgi:thioredoxin reductase
VSSIPPVDVVIAGGGPAGLSAALLLGRCLRSVIVCDAGRPRNERSPAMHGFLGHDGISPADFIQRGRDQLKLYTTISLVSGTIDEVIPEDGSFRVITETGIEWNSRSVLIATGLLDRLPEVPGIERYYGTSVHHCPFCDAWENRGRRIGVVGGDEAAEESQRNF